MFVDLTSRAKLRLFKNTLKFPIRKNIFVQGQHAALNSLKIFVIEVRGFQLISMSTRLLLAKHLDKAKTFSK